MRYQILYRTAPAWAAKERPMPDDYPGYVIAVKPENHQWGPGDIRGARRVVIMDLTDEEYAKLQRRELKVSADGKSLEPVSFDDHWGVMAEKLREKLPNPEAVERAVAMPSSDEKKNFEMREMWVSALRAAKEEFAKQRPVKVEIEAVKEGPLEEECNDARCRII